MDDLLIRPMIKTDAQAVGGLAGELGYPCTAADIRARLEMVSQTDFLRVAASSDQPRGFIQANRTCVIEVGSWVEIVGLVVSSKVRRSGIGRRLISEVERWAEGFAAKRVVVRSNTKRDESHRFYPAMGYELAKTQAVYQKKLS